MKRRIHSIPQTVKIQEESDILSWSDHKYDPQHTQREENSLSLLTKKFVDLIRQQKDQTIDLNMAVSQLRVQKRRIYDITNVLEGIGYVQKMQKNTIKWMGGCQQMACLQDIELYLKELTKLNQKEKQLQNELDQLKLSLTEKYLDQDVLNKYAYLSQHDLNNISKTYAYEKETSSKNKGSLVVISAPSGSSLEGYAEIANGTSKLILQLAEDGDGIENQDEDANEGMRVFMTDEGGKITEYKNQEMKSTSK